MSFIWNKLLVKNYISKNNKGNIDDINAGRIDFGEVILPGCNKKESSIFKDLCDFCLDNGFDAEIDPVAILGMVSKYYDENLEKLPDKIDIL